MMPWRPLGIPQEEVDAFVKHFKERARFYLDEDTHEAARYVLEAQGYKVKTARDAGMVRRDDEDHAALCWREGMILVTCDHDYLSPGRVPDHRNPGIVVLEVAARGEEAVIRATYFLSIIVGPFGRHWRQTRLLINANGEVTVWVRNADIGAVEKIRFRLLPGREVEQWVEERAGT
jgi:hypothetical protein